MKLRMKEPGGYTCTVLNLAGNYENIVGFASWIRSEGGRNRRREGGIVNKIKGVKSS